MIDNIFAMHFMNISISITKRENHWMSRHNDILSIFLIYKSMTNFCFSLNEYNHCKNICVYTHTHSTEIFQSGKFLVHCQSATITVIHRHSHANTIGLIH